jgi:hypothetical protein
MKVCELIEKLKDMDGELDVVGVDTELQELIPIDRVIILTPNKRYLSNDLLDSINKKMVVVIHDATMDYHGIYLS